MAKKLNKDGYGKVAGENMTGKPVPRKAGLKDQTKGKTIGTRKISGFGGTGPFDFVGRK